MRAQGICGVLAVVCISLQAFSGVQARVAMPLVGTWNSRELSHGNLYPAICVPWGMHAWSPQTTADRKTGWFYDWTAPRIHCIRQTHQPSPWMGDYGEWGVLPVVGAFETNDENRASWHSHSAETAEASYYRVYLADFDTTFEIAPTMRAAVMRVVYPATDAPAFVVDSFGGEVCIDGANRVRGVSRARRPVTGAVKSLANRFILEFDRPFAAAEIHGGVAYVRFAPTLRGESVNVRAASSFISGEQAERNLAELGADGVDGVRRRGETEWNRVLGRIAVEGGTDDERRMFYTCLYRALQFPRTFHEVDAEGRIVHFSPSDGSVRPGRYFGGTGFWDTFRALYPLLTFLYPEVVGEMMEGLQNCHEESGWLPEWSNPGLANCMIGNNSASVVADAIMAGVPGRYDPQKLYAALLHGANAVHPKLHTVGRIGFGDYNALGYVPRDRGVDQSAARTLEYAYDDWCIAELGERLGRPADEVSLYRARSANWRNVFDPVRKIACGRAADGTFNPSFDPFAWGGDFTEGCAWHYTWSVFHDVPGLAEAMGGAADFEAKLDAVFSMPPKADWSYYGKVIHEIREMQISGMGQYAHGNQPIQHMIYLYDWCGAWPKAQKRAREVMDRLYRPTPDGYCGDEDNGQTSAWYVWSAMGMYPVCPVSGEYALGAPLFDRVELSLPGCGGLVVEAKGASMRKIFDFAELGGRRLEGPFVKRNDLLHGGTLRFMVK